MIDTQRLGAYLRALMREDAALARLRTLPVSPASPLARVTDDGALAPGAALAAHAPVDEPLVPGTRATPGRPDDGVVDRRVAAHDGGPVPVRGAREPSGTPVAATAAAATTAQPSAALALSATALMLRDVLRVPTSAAPPTSAGIRMSVPASAARPLLGVPPHSEVATDRLALTLKDTVEFSGLFYESHLAQWADELRPRELLALEPQSRWAAGHDGATPAAASTEDAAAPLVRRQLDVLDSGRFLWRGDLWPGQPGALVIEEEDAPPRQDGDAPRAAPPIRMRVELTMPGLGRVNASLGINGDLLTVAVRCDEPRAAAALREAAPVLRAAIGQRSLDVASLAITDGHA